jgi:cullin-associated NEDD8-dissociated protein 1
LNYHHHQQQQQALSLKMSDVGISALLKKTEHYDKDERYMATSDLCEVLKRQAGNSGAAAANAAAAQGGAVTTTTTTAIMDNTTERQICTAVLRLLHDKSNDVQAIAVKTLGVLLTTVKQEQVLEIADSLADQVLDASKSELRDVYAIGLRTLVKTIPSSMGDRVAQRLVGRLLDGIRTLSTSEEIVLCCLDILTDLLGRFGASAISVTRQHEAILQMCLQQLSSSSASASSTAASTAVVRKRAGNTMACLSTVLSDALLMRMVESLLSQIDKSSSSSKKGKGANAATAGAGVDTRALIRTMCTVSGAVGHRLGQEQIDRILPIFLRFTNPEDAITGDDDDDDHHHDGDNNAEMENAQTEQEEESGDVDMADDSGHHHHDDDAAATAKNELRESCFVGFESFVLRCPLKQVEPHLEKIIQAALAYMSYDPNYSYGTTTTDDKDDIDPKEDAEQEEEEEEDEYEEEEEDEEEDDDDESWKVRRGAVRALKAVVEALRGNPTSLWTKTYRIRSRGGRQEPPVVVAAALVGRFKEREENCRVGVIDCFTRLLQVTIQASNATAKATAAAAAAQQRASTAASSTPTKGTVATASAAPILRLICHGDNDSSENNKGIVLIDLHQSDYAAKVVKSCEKILSTKKGNERSKSGALALLSTFCKAPGGIGGQAAIASVFSHVQPFLASSSSSSGSGSGANDAISVDDAGLSSSREGTSKALRLDALSLIHTMLASDNHDPVHIRLCLRGSLLPELCTAVKEQWYKVIAEALRALANVPEFFVIGYTAADGPEVRAAERTKVAQMLHEAMEPLLAAHDVDHEIKECALKAAAALLSNLHASLSVESKNRLLALLLERLKNETTRIAAIKNLAVIAGSASKSTLSLSNDDMEEEAERIDLSLILADAISAMSSFLKLQSRSLKQSTLEAMNIVVTNHGSLQEFQDGELFSSVVQDFAPLVMDTDLHLSHLSLRCTVSVLQVCLAAGPAVKAHVLEPAMVMATSSLLQDLALESLLAFFKQLVASKAVEFNELLFLLRQRLNGKVGKQGIYNLAKCIATITVATTPENGQTLLNEIFSLLESSSSSTPADAATLRQVQLGLLITGDLGRMIDLSSPSTNGAAERLKPIYMSYFDSKSEDLKHAAAYALGSAAVCAHTTFIPAIVAKLDEDNKKHQYLLLSALRGFIQYSAAAQKSSKTNATTSAGESLARSLPEMLPPLEKHCAEEEEGVRTMVAECLGSLTCFEPALMLKKLEELQTAHSPREDQEVSKEDAENNALVCWTVATSVKLAIAGRVNPVQLAMYMPSFVQLLHNKELHVRNAALLLVYSAVHHMPQVVSGLLKDTILPALFEVSNLKLQRMVDFGPFKHYVDDALPLRKAALSIFATCLESLPGAIDMASFMPVLAKALGDAEDIQLHAHQIVISMCTRQQSSFLVSSVVDSFVEPLEKTMKKKPGQKTGTELERLNDWIKSALRVMLALSKVEGVMNSHKFTELVERTKADPKFAQMLQVLQEES